MQSNTAATYHSIRFPTVASQVSGTFPLGLHHFDRWITKPSHEAWALATLLCFPGGLLGIERSEKQELTGLFRQAYRGINRTPQLNALPSAVATTFRPVRPGEGHAFVQIPSPSMADGEAILFLHGSGGNLLFNLWGLSQIFPEKLLILPSWSLDWQLGDATRTQRQIQYLHDLQNHLVRELGLDINRPWIMGLSNGGPPAFRIAEAHPNLYRGLVGLATEPEDSLGLEFPEQFPILLINGERDTRFPIDSVRLVVLNMRRRGLNCFLRELDAGHFFFLSHPGRVRETIVTFCQHLERDLST